MKRLLISLTVVVLAAILYAVLGRGGAEKANDAKSNGTPPVMVSIAPVTRQDVPIEIMLVGTVQAYESVAVRSRLDSQIMEVRFKNGEQVQEGQVLFLLDDRTLNAQLKQQAALAAQSHSQVKRYAQLAKEGFASAEKFDALKTADATAQAQLDSLRTQLGYTVIKAPISGRVGTINVTRGNTVKANDTSPLVTINQIQPIRVQLAIPQRYYEPVRQAMPEVNVRLTSKNNENQDGAVTGRLEYIDNAIDPATGTFTARAVFANGDENLWPGMFADAVLMLGEDKQALTLPLQAIQGEGEQRFVFALDEEGKKAVKKPIKISRVNDILAIVTEGLAEKELVISDGLLRVSDGAAVTVQDKH